VRDHDPLLLAAGQLAHPRVGVPPRADRGQHVVDELAAGPGRQPDAELVPVEPERDHVPDPQRRVRLDAQLLRHVADRGVAGRSRGAVEEHLAGGYRLEAEDDAEERGLARSVRADKTGELPRVHGQ
jgi:hypothetical protein